MKKMIFTAGCYDCLHEAHISFLKKSKSLGDYLVVGINNDEYFKIKGPNRPIDNQYKRKEKLYSTHIPDKVIIFNESPINLIMLLEPDIITVCNEYNEKTIIGFEECKLWGGKVVIFDRTPGISTTELIKKLHENQ